MIVVVVVTRDMAKKQKKKQPVRRRKKPAKKKKRVNRPRPSMLVLARGSTDEKQYDLAKLPDQEGRAITAPTHLKDLPIDKPRRSARDIGY